MEVTVTGLLRRRETSFQLGGLVEDTEESKIYRVVLGGREALLHVSPFLLDNREWLKGSLHSAVLSARLRHPNILPLLEAFYEEMDWDGGKRFVVGRITPSAETLLAYVRAEKRQLSDLLPILHRIGATLAYLHSLSIAFRDLDPSNFTSRGEIIGFRKAVGYEASDKDYVADVRDFGALAYYCAFGVARKDSSIIVTGPMIPEEPAPTGSKVFDDWLVRVRTRFTSMIQVLSHPIFSSYNLTLPSQGPNGLAMLGRMRDASPPAYIGWTEGHAEFLRLARASAVKPAVVSLAIKIYWRQAAPLFHSFDALTSLAVASALRGESMNAERWLEEYRGAGKQPALAKTRQFNLYVREYLVLHGLTDEVTGFDLLPILAGDATVATTAGSIYIRALANADLFRNHREENIAAVCTLKAAIDLETTCYEGLKVNDVEEILATLQ